MTDQLITPTPDLSIIIVNWNVRDLLRQCLLSLHNSPGLALLALPSTAAEKTKPAGDGTARSPASARLYEVIVVDNASADDSVAMVAAEFPWVRLIANTENRGFSGGNNQGIALCAGKYVFFLNPDTVAIGDAVSTMVAYMETHPRSGALGPQLCYGDGSHQPSRRRFPTLATALFESTPLAWHWPQNYWAKRYRMADRPVDETQEVDWLVGAALMVRREVLEQIGGFDEGYFMYSEELDLCRRIKKAGWTITYLPSAQIIHYEGKSSEQVGAARHIRFQTSKIRYFRKFHGPMAAESLRASILGLFALEWLFEAAKWLLGSKRPLRQERMAAFRQLLATRLRYKSD